jgi:hypothetical protein
MTRRRPGGAERRRASGWHGRRLRPRPSPSHRLASGGGAGEVTSPARLIFRGRPAISQISRRPGDRGATAVEFALLLPVLLLTLFGLIDFGRALNAQITLTQAAREGARLAALNQPDVVSRTQAAATGLSPVSVTVVSACPATASATADAVVRVTYQFTFVTPVSAIAAMFGGSGLGSGLTLTAQGTMPCGG